MAYDSNTLPEAALEEVAIGFQKPEERGALADAICRRREVRTPRGEYDALDVAAMMPSDRSSNRRASGTKFGDDLPNRQDKFDATRSYQCLRYGGEDDIKKSDVSRIVEETDLDAIEHKLRMCKQDGEVQIDGRLDDILTDNTLNQTQAAQNGTWDGASATPLKDIRAGYKKLPGASLGVYAGANVVDDLLSHPDLLAETSNFSGGQLGDGQLANLLRQKFSRVDQVIIGDSYFRDGSEEGQTYDLSYQSPDEFVLFVPEAITLLEDIRTGIDTGQNDGGSSGVINVWFARVVDLDKAHSETSVRFTGI